MVYLTSLSLRCTGKCWDSSWILNRKGLGKEPFLCKPTCYPDTCLQYWWISQHLAQHHLACYSHDHHCAKLFGNCTGRLKVGWATISLTGRQAAWHSLIRDLFMEVPATDPQISLPCLKTSLSCSSLLRFRSLNVSPWDFWFSSPYVQDGLQTGATCIMLHL